MSARRFLRIGAHALRAVAAHRTGTAFSVLAAALGICALTLTEATVRGANERIDEFAQWFGTDAAFVAGGEIRNRPAGFRSETVTMADWRAVRDSLPGTYDVTASRMVRGKQLRRGAASHESPVVVGSMPGFTSAWNWPLAEGRDLDWRDELSRSRVCLLGEVPRRELFGDAPPVGETIWIDGRDYVVAGLLSERGFASESLSVDDRVVVPFSTLTRQFNLNRNSLRGIRVKFLDSSDMEGNIAGLRSFLRHLHRLEPGQDDDFSIVTISEIYRFLSVMRVGIAVFLTAVSLAVLAGSGFVVANLAYLGISLRGGELGLLMALGATRRDIMLHIGLELMIVNMAGAALGCLLGEAASLAVNAAGALTVSTSWRTLVLAVGAGLALTLVFGMRPARAAAGLQPDQALRESA